MKCDAHFHVFGPEGSYPYVPDLRYKPPHAPLDAYLAEAKHMGIERYVLVQPSAYGRDNRCMLDAMRVIGTKQCRGIVDVDETATERELDDMHRLGVRGVRVNVNPIKPEEPGFSRTMLHRIDTLDRRCAERGWMLDFLTPGWLTRELLPVFERLKAAFSVAHMGMFLAKHGASQPGFRDFVAFVAGSEHCWVKLTGVYRISTAPAFADAAPLARALIEAAPARLIWGSDYPHLSFADKVSSMSLYRLFETWAPDEPTRQRILVDNPRRCFGF
ncbi:MAG TPA: amidohydrolase family protein [Burkholderiales bacterium]|nr:amidohydrolase family protein [Burkholderiales bacterium]